MGRQIVTQKDIDRAQAEEGRSNDLLSCPFCGISMRPHKDAETLRQYAYHPGGWGCLLGGQYFDIKKWNKRAR